MLKLKHNFIDFGFFKTKNFNSIHSHSNWGETVLLTTKFSKKKIKQFFCIEGAHKCFILVIVHLFKIFSAALFIRCFELVSLNSNVSDCESEKFREKLCLSMKSSTTVKPNTFLLSHYTVLLTESFQSISNNVIIGLSVTIFGKLQISKSTAMDKLSKI